MLMFTLSSYVHCLIRNHSISHREENRMQHSLLPGPILTLPMTGLMTSLSVVIYDLFE